MGLLDSAWLIFVTLGGTAAASGLLLKVSFEYLKGEEENIEIVKMDFLGKIKNELRAAHKLRLKIPTAVEGHLEIIDLKPLDRRLKILADSIRDYRFWSAFVRNARKRLNYGAGAIIVAGVLLGSVEYDAALQSVVFRIAAYGFIIEIGASTILGMLVLFAVGIYVYSIVWTLHQRNRLEDAIGKARTVPIEEGKERTAQ